MINLFGRLQEKGIVAPRLCADSRKILRGDTFVALPGLMHDGRLAIEEAIQKGAGAIVFDAKGFSWASLDAFPKIGIFDLASRLNEVAPFFVNNLSDFTCVGITGTNGKTSTAWFIAKACERLQVPSAYVGTLGQGPIHDLKPCPNTTPDTFALFCLFQQLEKENTSRVIMEVSSHAIDQKRVDALNFKIGILTNLSRDHLDYHGTMNHYLKTKAKLAYLADTALIYAEEPYFQALARKSWALTYGFSPRCDFYVKSYAQSPEGLALQLLSPFGKVSIKAPLMGAFNAANLLAAASALFLLGHSACEVESALQGMEPPPGRLQRLHVEGRPQVFVDYAHTPDALAAALCALKANTPGQLYVVFGCGGNRDRGKRAQMGAIAQHLADHVILTSDNPRHEDPQAIIDDILSGMKKMPKVVPDRQQAIFQVIQEATAKDVILIAGKGHERVQILSTGSLPFDDVAIAKAALQC